MGRETLNLYRTSLDRSLVTYQVCCERLVEDQKRAISADDRLTSAQEAQKLVQHVAQKIQQDVHSRIAGVVSRCLEAVFDDPYRFHIEFEQKRGRTEAKLQFIRGEFAVDPMTASGGGVIDVASFALRLACLMLSKPRLRKVLILDEPFKHLSEEYRPRVAELLLVLSEEMDVQIIMVTHDPIFKVGKVIQL